MAFADHSDYFMLALCLWREARGEGTAGMAAVGAVVRNRANRHGTSYYHEVIAPWQFSSITAKGDPQLTVYPNGNDLLWQLAQSIGRDIVGGAAFDPTGGATLYWNPNGIETDKKFTLPDGSSVKFPASWNPAKVQFTVKIGHHYFLREI